MCEPRLPYQFPNLVESWELGFLQEVSCQEWKRIIPTEPGIGKSFFPVGLMWFHSSTYRDMFPKFNIFCKLYHCYEQGVNRLRVSLFPPLVKTVNSVLQACMKFCFVLFCFLLMCTGRGRRKVSRCSTEETTLGNLEQKLGLLTLVLCRPPLL